MSLSSNYSDFRAYAYLIMTTFMWGCNTVFARLAVDQVSPMLLVSMRWLGAVLLLFVFFRGTVKTAFVKLKPDFLQIFIMAGIGFTGFNVLFYIAAYYTTALNIGIIQGSIPVFIVLGAYVLRRVSFSLLQIAGIISTILGVIVVSSYGELQKLKYLTINKGDYFIITACVLYSAYSLGLSRFVGKVSPLELFSMLAVAGFLTSLPVVSIEYIHDGLQWPTAQGWLVVALITVFPSFLAQIFYIQGVSDVGAGRAGIFINLVPVFASLLVVLVLNEKFQFYHVAALSLVLGGIGLFEIKKDQKNYVTSVKRKK